MFLSQQLLSEKLNSNLTLGRKLEELQLQQYERGDEITALDSGIWQIYRGVVQLSRIQLDGTEVVLGWVTANGIFSDSQDNSSTSYRAVALSNVYARRYYLQDMVNNPSLARQFLAQFSDRLLKSEELLSIIAIRKVEDRLRELLLMLRREIGQSVTHGVRLQVRFTHQQLAEAICTTRVTITRILGNFQSRNSIYFDSERHIVIRSL